MAKNSNLSQAKRAKNDEFYTQFVDIEREMNAYLEYDENVFRDKTILLPCDDPEWSNFTRYFSLNFDRFGMKKVISTSYAPASKPEPATIAPSDYETASPQYDAEKTQTRGKIFILERDNNQDSRIDYYDLEWEYLEDDGDFRSDEVRALRDEADIIVTNPPFSLFREFLAWIVEADKKFAIIGNKNSVTYKEVFPLIMNNQMWLGSSPMGIDMLFGVPDWIAEDFVENEKEGSKYKIVDGEVFGRAGAVWFTNIDHGRRHQPLILMTEADNFRFSKHKQVRGVGYQKYDNYDAIEVPYVTAIPSDYDGVMGVPISFLDKYNPDQFEILGSFNAGAAAEDVGAVKTETFSGGREIMWNGPVVNKKPVYKRILIRHRKDQNNEH